MPGLPSPSVRTNSSYNSSDAHRHYFAVDLLIYCMNETCRPLKLWQARRSLRGQGRHFFGVSSPHVRRPWKGVGRERG